LGKEPQELKRLSKFIPKRWIFFRTIPIDIPVAAVMMTSYSEEVRTLKTSKVKFVRTSTSSTSNVVPRTLQVREATFTPVPSKDRRILPSRSQSQSDSTSNGTESQVHCGPITRSSVKTLTYTEITL